MAPNPRTISEGQVLQRYFPDRWSKDLIGGGEIPTTSGFNLGVASYQTTEFGEPQVHDDQEALYVILGQGEIMLDDEVFPVQTGTAVLVPPGTRHATRRTGPEPVKVVYTHGAV